MYFSDQGTDYLEIHWFPYVSKNLSPKIGQIFKMLNMHAVKIGRLCVPFWDLQVLNYMETNVFLGSLFLDLKGTSFLLI